MPRRGGTGSEELDAKIEALLDEVGATEDRDLLFEVVASGVLLATDEARHPG